MSRRPADLDADEGFLSRWSRRKAAAKSGQPLDDVEAAAALSPEGAASEPASPEPELDDAELLEKLGLPDPDNLNPGDDVAGFMSSAVPARLRNRALRRLWLANPTLANLDELLDYGEDFTDAACVVENLATAYKVGRGFITDDPPEDETGAAEPERSEAGRSDKEPSGEDRSETEVVGDDAARDAAQEPGAAERSTAEVPASVIPASAIPANAAPTYAPPAPTLRGDALSAVDRSADIRAAQPIAADEPSPPRPRRMRFQAADLGSDPG